MSNLIFFHGDKGGTGKSFSCSVFLDRIYQNAKYSVIDADMRNPDIYNSYGNSMSVNVMPLTNHDEWVDFFDYIEEQHKSDKNVVVSLPSQAGDIIEQEKELFISFMKEVKMKFFLVWVMNRQNDSIRLLNSALKCLPKTEKTLVVLNGFYGKEDQFSRWKDLEMRNKLLSDNGVEVFLPELHHAIVDILLCSEEIPLLPYSEAIVSGNLSTMRKLELGNWLKKAHSCFDYILAK